MNHGRSRSRRQRISDRVAPVVLLLFLIAVIKGSEDVGVKVVGTVSLTGILLYGAMMIFAARKQPLWLQGFLVGVGTAFGFAVLIAGNVEAVGEALGISLVLSAMAAAVLPPVGRVVLESRVQP